MVYGTISAAVLVRLGPPILILVVPFGAAFVAWWRWGRQHPPHWTHRLNTLFVLLLAAQLLHLTEEYLTGFHRTFPALWGAVTAGDAERFAAWPTDVFMTGNLLMTVLWLLALLLLPRGGAWATFTLWLFVTGMAVNAVGHPLYALYAATHPALCTLSGHPCWYFPGLITAGLHMALVPALLRAWRSS